MLFRSLEVVKSAFGFCMFDDLQLNAMLGGCVLGVFSGVALVDVGKFHMVFGDLLHRCGELFYLRAVLLAGSSDMQGQQVPQRLESTELYRRISVSGRSHSVQGRFQQRRNLAVGDQRADHQDPVDHGARCRTGGMECRFDR